jgi:holin-like protein
MKYILQFLVILGFTFLGEVLSYVIPFPIPAAIYGLVLLFLALWTGLVKPGQVKEVSSFLISILTVFFVAPAVRILEYWGVIGPYIGSIVIICVISTYLVFAVSALVTQILMKKKKEDAPHG